MIREQKGIKGRVRIVTHKAGTKEILRVSDWQDNLIMLGADTGKDLILDRLNGNNAYSLNITHADIGTGTNTPAASDTALQTPAARGPKASGNISSNVLTLQFFFADIVLPNGDYTEFGTFIDGSGGVSTGKIFNRVLFGTPYTKSSGEDTTVEVQITVT